MTSIACESARGWSSGIDVWRTPISRVDSIDRRDLSHRRFQCEYVNKCRPLHIRGGASLWPANQRLNEKDYLVDKLGNEQFSVFTKPVRELRWRESFWPDRFKESFNKEDRSTLNFVELQERAISQEFVFAYSVRLEKSSKLAGLAEDVADFEFLPNPRPPRYYTPLRVFLHGRSYTDWHYHPDDETLMCQFARKKTVTLLPPSQVWDIFFEVARMQDYIGTADPSAFPKLASLQPSVVEVEHGDACYIPPHWWHAVECKDTTPALGFTAAYCWRSPNHIRFDPRFPYRHFILTAGKFRKRAKIALDTILWNSLRMTGKALREIP